MRQQVSLRQKSEVTLLVCCQSPDLIALIFNQPEPSHRRQQHRLLPSSSTHTSLLLYVGHRVYIDRYFQCLGPQEISRGKLPKNTSPHFPATKLERPISLPPRSTSPRRRTICAVRSQTLGRADTPSGVRRAEGFKNSN